MKEILACNLKPLFNTLNLNGKCTYKGKIYEVWEISEKTFNILCDMNEDEFMSVCPEGMWRYSIGSVLDEPDVEYKVNGKVLIGWNKYREEDICLYCPCTGCPRTEDIKKDCIVTEYSCLTEYLCDCIGASLPRNVCALAKDLALYNKMTMGQLFVKYEGDNIL